MVPGFNHNVKCRGKAYHVQTEDLGLDNPCIVTHLFAGGNVVATVRKGYAELVGKDDLGRSVRALMEEQHKQVLRNLVAGAYDVAHPTATPAAPQRRAGPGPAREQAPASQRQPLELDVDQNIEQVILAYLAGEPVGRDR